MQFMADLAFKDLEGAPLSLVRFPIELRAPAGFRPEDLSTWPRVEGRLEYFQGRLLFMPPSGDVQQEVSSDVVTLLNLWTRTHTDFVAGGNEAGMRLGTDVRAADAAVWRLSDVGRLTGGVRTVPPVLAVEVAGRDEDEQALRGKARWYLERGVEAVWLVLPDTREVVVVTAGGDCRIAPGTRVPAPSSLPDLSPDARDFFIQLDRRT